MLVKKVILFYFSFSTLYMSKTTKKIVFDEEFSLDNQTKKTYYKESPEYLVMPNCPFVNEITMSLGKDNFLDILFILNLWGKCVRFSF